MLQQNQTIKERFRNCNLNIYNLCDYMIKRASILSALHYKFSTNDLSILKLVQNGLSMSKESLDSINTPDNSYEGLDLDYEIYRYECPKCEGYVKVVEFEYNGAGHAFNVYECQVCGEEIVDNYPNKQEHVIEYFDIIIKWEEDKLSDENITEEDKIKFTKQLKNIKKEKKQVYNENESVIKTRNDFRNGVLSAIEKGEDYYKELLKSKHVFDRNIGEA